MDTADHIPPEIRARVEASELFLALHRGDLARAARHQERLRQLGWILIKEQPSKPRRQGVAR